MTRRSICVLATLWMLSPLAFAESIEVATDDALRAAVERAQPGDAIRVAPGTYKAGLRFSDVRGTAEQPITIEAADPEAGRPVFKGGNQGLHFADPAHLTLRGLVIEGVRYNGLNIDDGGEMDSTAVGITLENLTIRRVGPRGNCDGIKLSGVRRFVVRNCRVERWGDGGSGIDMVGCAEGRIVGCHLEHTGDTATSSGVQAKGGSRDIVIERNTFVHTGRRGVNLGGSTGERYFRPPLTGDGDHVEAARITVGGNTFIGCNAPVAFTTSIDCTVEANLFVRPGKWVMRILQEKPTDRFAATADGVFRRNVIVWRSAELARQVNIGPNTRPRTFRFAENLWYCTDRPDRSRPDLPTDETDGVHGTDPQVEVDEDGVARIGNAAAAKRYGPAAWTNTAPESDPEPGTSPNPQR